MQKNYEYESDKKQKTLDWQVLGIFSIVIFLICGLLFLFEYQNAYKTSGDWFPANFAVKFYYLVFAIISIIAAVVLKIIFKNRVSAFVLVTAAIVLPMIFYQFNYHTLKKDGPLYPLVDKGGIFHFITIGDYNFDGINDEEYHISYDERTESMRYGGHFDDTIIEYIDTTATGTGKGLSGCFCFYDWEERNIQLFLNKDTVKLKEIKILVSFQDPAMAQNVSFFIDSSKLNHTVNKNGTVSIIFDADTCSDLQKRFIPSDRYIPIKYVVPE